MRREQGIRGGENGQESAEDDEDHEDEEAECEEGVLGAAEGEVHDLDGAGDGYQCARTREGMEDGQEEGVVVAEGAEDAEEAEGAEDGEAEEGGLRGTR